jgi:hypothetical protein
LRTEANCDPFCTRPAFCAADVLGLKKAVQFAVISCSSAAMDDAVEDADGEADAVAEGVTTADGVCDDGDALGAELPLPHAAALTPTANASRIQQTDLRVFIQHSPREAM